MFIFKNHYISPHLHIYAMAYMCKCGDHEFTLIKRKGRTFRCTPSITFIPVSRILSTILLLSDSHLSGPDITIKLKRRSRTRRARPCTEARNFAVAPLSFDKIIPFGTLTFRYRRHCSHLSDCSGRALPATLLREKSRLCSDFPPW